MNSNSQTQTTAPAPQPNTTHNNPLFLPGSLIFILPIVLILGVFTRQQYRIISRHRRIAKLERIWQLTAREKTR